jgi:hypothetical protein
MWAYVKANWSALQSRFQGAFLLSRVTGSATEGFADDATANDIEAFFAARPAEVRRGNTHLGQGHCSRTAPPPPPSPLNMHVNVQEAAAVERTLRQSLERVRISARWLARDGEGVAAWLQANMTA